MDGTGNQTGTLPQIPQNEAGDAARTAPVMAKQGRQPGLAVRADRRDGTRRAARHTPPAGRTGNPGGTGGSARVAGVLPAHRDIDPATQGSTASRAGTDGEF